MNHRKHCCCSCVCLFWQKLLLQWKKRKLLRPSVSLTAVKCEYAERLSAAVSPLTRDSFCAHGCRSEACVSVFIILVSCRVACVSVFYAWMREVCVCVSALSRCMCRCALLALCLCAWARGLFKYKHSAARVGSASPLTPVLSFLFLYTLPLYANPSSCVWCVTMLFLET